MHRPPSRNNELASFWGDKAFWRKRKSEAIEKARAFYRDNKPSFSQLYWYVAELRYEIAKEQLLRSPLEANIIDHFGTPRNKDLNPIVQERYQKVWDSIPTNHDLTTPITEESQYGHYFEYLLSLFKSENSNPLKISYDDPLLEEPIQLTWIHLNDDDDEIKIEHAPRLKLDNFLNICDEFYENFHQNHVPIVKLMTLKTFMWFAFQGTFCWRGSASIQEIITEVLIAENKIDWHYSSRHIPLDLVALFCTSPEKFIEEIDKIALDPHKDRLLDDLVFYCEDLQSTSSNTLKFHDASLLERIFALRKLIKKISGEKIDFTAKELIELKDKNITTILTKHDALHFITNNSSTAKNTPTI